MEKLSALDMPVALSTAFPQAWEEVCLLSGDEDMTQFLTRAFHQDIAAYQGILTENSRDGRQARRYSDYPVLAFISHTERRMAYVILDKASVRKADVDDAPCLSRTQAMLDKKQAIAPALPYYAFYASDTQ